MKAFGHVVSSSTGAALSNPSTPPASDAVGAVAEPLSLVGLEFSLETASLDALEQVARAVTQEQVREWFELLTGTEEVASLSTCHRVELVFLSRSSGEIDRWQHRLPGARSSWVRRQGAEVVHHLFRVAAGRESLALGEAEVRTQVRAAAGSVESRHPRPVLRELFTEAARNAEQVGPRVPTSGSIAAVAARRLMDLVARPWPRVLVVGSGTIGRQLVECLAPTARVTMVYHQRLPDESLLRATRTRGVALEHLSEELLHSDAVVTAAKFGHRGLGPADLPHDRPIVLVDLGVPRNIDPEVRHLPNVRLVDLEELHALSPRPSVADPLDNRVRELARTAFDRVERLLYEPWVAEFRRSAEDLRRAELSRARAFLGELDPDQEAALERLTQRLVNRLLLASTERIRSLPPGPDADHERRLALEVLRTTSTDP